MTTASRQTGPRKFPLVPVIFGAVAVALVVTIILTFDSGTVDAFGTPVVTGDALAPFGDGADAAVGQMAPSVAGENFTGDAVTITNDGRPKMIILLAHWCSHCQNEVPVVQAWLDAGQLPAGVDIYSVATGTTDTRDNYPPQTWLEREGWTPPVIADDQAYTVGDAFGLTAFPFWVFVNADGTVAARTTGELSPEVITQIVQGLVSG